MAGEKATVACGMASNTPASDATRAFEEFMASMHQGLPAREVEDRLRFNRFNQSKCVSAARISSNLPKKEIR
jgi:hypothetical protein